MSTPFHIIAIIGLSSSALVAGELTIEKKPFEVTTTVDATVMPAGDVELLVIEPKQWSDFTIRTIANHGASIRKGDMLVEFDSRGIDQTIEDLQAQIATREVEITQQKAALERMKETAGDRLAALRHAADVARSDHEYFKTTERKALEDASAQSVRELKEELENQQEELRQLKAMYEADDLTEATEEIILTRQQNAVASAEFMLKMGKLEHDREIQVLLPRRAIELDRAERNAVVALKFGEESIPREITLKQKALEALETAQARDARRLEDLQNDRKQFTLTAASNGTFYHGSLDAGTWTTGELIRQLRPGGSAPQHQAFATLVPKETNLGLFAFVKPETARMLAEGDPGTAVLLGNEAYAFGVGIATIERVPETNGSHRVLFKPSWDKATAGTAVAGNPARIDLLVHHNPEAIRIPAAAVRYGAKGWTVEVKLADGKTERRPVKPGMKSGNDVEILDGLDAGQVIVTP